jgi:hypothetical protein
MKIIMEHWWNYIDRAKRKFLNRNLPQCHFICQTGPGWNPGHKSV